MAQQAPGSPPPRNLEDAIARVKAASAARDRVLAGKARRKIFTTDLQMPDHPHARWVRRGGAIALAIGTVMIIALPDRMVIHTLAFALMFALTFMAAPNVTLRDSGAVSLTKLLGWSAIFLFLGAMTATAAGTTGNLWSWAPWMQQFGQPGT